EQQSFVAWLRQMTGAGGIIFDALASHTDTDAVMYPLLSSFTPAQRAVGQWVLTDGQRINRLEAAAKNGFLMLMGGVKPDKLTYLANFLEYIRNELQSGWWDREVPITIRVYGALAYPLMRKRGMEIGHSHMPTKTKDIERSQRGIEKIDDLVEE